MSTPCVTVQSPRHDPAVWEDIWNRDVPIARDDALLERERRGRRWALVRAAVEESFGGFSGLRCVELGSGRGDLSVLMAEAGAAVTLVDYCEAALDAARARFMRLGLEAEFHRADFLNELDIPANSFHVVSSLGVIEHFRGSDRLRAVRAHERALVPGGLALISVPHARCLPYRLWKWYLERRGCWPYGMELPYSRRELGQLCSHAGFGRIALHSFGFWQSVGDHWVKRLTHYLPDWSAVPSLLDSSMGLILLAIAESCAGRQALEEKQGC